MVWQYSRAKDVLTARQPRNISVSAQYGCSTGSAKPLSWLHGGLGAVTIARAILLPPIHKNSSYLHQPQFTLATLYSSIQSRWNGSSSPTRMSLALVLRPVISKARFQHLAKRHLLSRLDINAWSSCVQESLHRTLLGRKRRSTPR